MKLPLKDTPEESLTKWWLYVWRCLVERHWNLVRKDDEDNDPHYIKICEKDAKSSAEHRVHLKGMCSKPHYTFASMRYDRCRSTESIDEDVASLARNYWERNRFDLKEYFVNLTYKTWPDAANFELYVAASGSEWIDCGTDPAYPSRRNSFDKFGGEHLAECGWLKDNLVDAMCDADALFARIHLKEWKEEHAKEVEAKKRLRRQKFNSLKKRVMSLFSLKFLEK